MNATTLNQTQSLNANLSQLVVFDLMANNSNASSIPVLKMDFVNFLDNATRAFSLIIHTIYFIIVFTHQKQMIQLSLFHMHHVNIIGLMSALHYSMWINSVQPLFPDPILNRVFCSMAETAFAVFKFTRAYSILGLALYRVLAVFKINLYKQVCESYSFTVVTTALIWLCGIFVFLIGKYAVNTIPGPILCIDGSSPYQLNSILYYTITTLLGLFLPIIIVIIAYVAITKRLNVIANRLNKNKSFTSTDQKSKMEMSRTYSVNKVAPDVAEVRMKKVKSTKSLATARDSVVDMKSTAKEGSSVLNDSSLVDSTSQGPRESRFRLKINWKDEQMKANNREKRLSKQFLVLNLIEIGSATSLSLLYITNTIPHFNEYFYSFRQLSRVGNLACQSAIPIMTLVYHPFEFKLFKFIKNITS